MWRKENNNEIRKTCEAIQKKIECLKDQIICSQEACVRLLPNLMSGEIEALDNK